MAKPIVVKTLKEFLERYPDTVLPCICDESPMIFGHTFSCPKSSSYESYKSLSEGYVLYVLQGPPRDCGHPGLFNQGAGQVSCNG